MCLCMDCTNEESEDDGVDSEADINDDSDF